MTFQRKTPLRYRQLRYVVSRKFHSDWFDNGLFIHSWKYFGHVRRLGVKCSCRLYFQQSPNNVWKCSESYFSHLFSDAVSRSLCHCCWLREPRSSTGTINSLDSDKKFPLKGHAHILMNCNGARSSQILMNYRACISLTYNWKRPFPNTKIFSLQYLVDYSGHEISLTQALYKFALHLS